MQPFDPDLGDPIANDIRLARSRGDLAPTLTALAATRGQWDRRWFLLDRIDGEEPRALFDQLVAAQAPFAHLLRGVHAIASAWVARGKRYGRDVTPEGHRLFAERSASAAEDLSHAASLDPEDPTPWAFLLRASFPLKWPVERAQAIFDEVRRRDPEHLPAYRWMQWWLSAKWHGDAERMFAFARGAIASVPPGSSLHGLLVRAHLDQQDSIARAQGDAAADAYIASVRPEILWARGQGVGHPQHRRREWDRLTHQDLLETHYLARDRRAMSEELAVLGPRLDPVRFGVDAVDGVQEVARMRAYAAGPAATPRTGAGTDRLLRNPWVLVGAFLVLAILVSLAMSFLRGLVA